MQANKAGLMEVADVFVINKADRAGVHETRRDLQQMLELSAETGHGAGWKVPITTTIASTGDGVAELWEIVTTHRDHVVESGELERRRRFRLGEELRDIVARRLEQRAREVCTGERWDVAHRRRARRHGRPVVGRRRDARPRSSDLGVIRIRAWIVPESGTIHAQLADRTE